jgi:hypothetical protein
MPSRERTMKKRTMKKRTIKNRKTKKQKRVHKKQKGGGPKCPNCGSTNTYCTRLIPDRLLNSFTETEEELIKNNFQMKV